MRTEDGSIIRECLNGKPWAFGVLVDKYKAGIYAFVYTELRNFHDAEDVTQEVFLQAYRGLRSLRRWESFSFWLYRIALNLCKKWIRTQSRRPDGEFIEDQDPRMLEVPSVDFHREDRVNESLREALDSLPRIYREVIMLHYFGGMDTRDIAEATGTSPSTVRKRLSRARAQLKEEMIAMMGTAFEEQRLQASFTFRIVEAVKRVRIDPVPRTAGLPWGMSLAVGIIATVLSLNPHLSIPGDVAIPASSPLPVESNLLETGEIPVDIWNNPRLHYVPVSQVYGNGGGLGISDQQNAVLMAPRGEGITIPEEPSARLGKGDARDQIFSVAFSPDGKILASGFFNGTIELWDVRSQKQSGVLKGHTAHAIRLAFSPDGRILASGSHDRTIRLWDLQTQKEIGVLQNGSYAHCVAFSPDGKILASACGEQMQVRLWDVDAQKQIDVLQYGHCVQAVAFSPDGKILASGNAGGVIPLWDVEGQEHIGELKGHTDWIWTVTFSPDGKWLASASGDRTVCLWDVDKQERIAILRGHTKPVHSVAFSPDGKYLASCDDGGMIILWDAESHEQLSVLQKEGEPVWGVAFSPDGKWLASGGWDNVVLLWEVNIPVQGKAVGSTGKLPGTWGEVKRTALLQNFPNPFNPETWIPFNLSKPESVTIRIYSSSGRIVRNLDLGQKPPGTYQSKEKAAYWDGRNEAGEPVASDVYFYVMEAGGHTGLKKMVLAR